MKIIFAGCLGAKETSCFLFSFHVSNSKESNSSNEPQIKKLKSNIQYALFNNTLQKNSKCSPSILYRKHLDIPNKRFNPKAHTPLFKRTIDSNYFQSKKLQNPSQNVLKILSKNQKDTIQLFSILNQKNIKLDDFARIYLDMSKKKISQLLKLTLRKIQLSKCQKINFEKIQNWIVMNLEKRKLIIKPRNGPEKSSIDYSFINRSKFYKYNLVKKLVRKYQTLNKKTSMPAKLANNVS